MHCPPHAFVLYLLTKVSSRIIYSNERQLSLKLLCKRTDREDVNNTFAEKTETGADASASRSRRAVDRVKVDVGQDATLASPLRPLSVEGGTGTGFATPLRPLKADAVESTGDANANSLSRRKSDKAPADEPKPRSTIVGDQPKRWYQNDFHFGKPVKADALMAFSRQLSSFLEAGIPVIEALEIVGEETASAPMRAVIVEVRESILRGVGFAASVGAHPKVFPRFYRAMLVSADYTGHLDEVLSQLASYLERDITARRQIKSALTYPIVVLCIACIAMVIMSIFVLPKFSGLYRSLGAKLPLPTRMLLGLTDFMTNDWPILLGVVCTVWLVSYLIVGGQRGKGRRDGVAMKLPVIGNLFHLISIERFCRVLSALVTAGIPLPEGISVSAEATNNSIFIAKLTVVREVLIRGGGLTQPIVESDIFPIAARQMIRVGERTGLLGRQLGKAATYYEREVAFHMKRATDLFEPMVILLVGVVVGFVAVAQVAAMYSIFGQVK
jgi:type IV pilus assembly protein PilC